MKTVKLSSEKNPALIYDLKFEICQFYNLDNNEVSFRIDKAGQLIVKSGDTQVWGWVELTRKNDTVTFDYNMDGNEHFKTIDINVSNVNLSEYPIDTTVEDIYIDLVTNHLRGDSAPTESQIATILRNNFNEGTHWGCGH